MRRCWRAHELTEKPTAGLSVHHGAIELGDAIDCRYPRCAPFAIGSRKSKIETVVVPVVQRIERRFPNAKNGISAGIA